MSIEEARAKVVMAIQSPDFGDIVHRVDILARLLLAAYKAGLRDAADAREPWGTE